MKKNKLEKIVTVILSIAILAIGSYFNIQKENREENNNTKASYQISNIPNYSGEIYIEINDNIPQFTTENINLEKDYYSNLEKGRVRNGYDKN
ncbi:MAG: hypothetical protein HFJ53_08785 [Clostridia bacterium]|jgi:hypothetical protein|nr:hypothetical protein [Clostridia bacterium]